MFSLDRCWAVSDPCPIQIDVEPFQIHVQFKLVLNRFRSRVQFKSILKCFYQCVVQINVELFQIYVQFRSVLYRFTCVWFRSMLNHFRSVSGSDQCWTVSDSCPVQISVVPFQMHVCFRSILNCFRATSGLDRCCTISDPCPVQISVVLMCPPEDDRLTNVSPDRKDGVIEMCKPVPIIISPIAAKKWDSLQNAVELCSVGLLNKYSFVLKLFVTLIVTCK